MKRAVRSDVPFCSFESKNLDVRLRRKTFCLFPLFLCLGFQCLFPVLSGAGVMVGKCPCVAPPGCFASTAINQIVYGYAW